MIILIPISNFCIAKLTGLETRQRKNKDARVKLMNEILSGIKVRFLTVTLDPIIY